MYRDTASKINKNVDSISVCVKCMAHDFSFLLFIIIIIVSGIMLYSFVLMIADYPQALRVIVCSAATWIKTARSRRPVIQPRTRLLWTAITSSAVTVASASKSSSLISSFIIRTTIPASESHFFFSSCGTTLIHFSFLLLQKYSSSFFFFCLFVASCRKPHHPWLRQRYVCTFLF